MNRQKWKRIEKILDQALCFKSLNEQKQFILKATKQHPTLRIELKDLLHAIHAAQQVGFMED
ncbi:hypothetical protein [Fodinibius salsisoli]|uniref:Uncharacterized protein n=1 Tax=Fodinibius salsisoli TaxID=2820877 RepID=A0ABT3PT10_9BACT|nr:hypothetical protein [Fodinibius salsisoli]MCW9709006.1 hypothetical protein [Fodinibius salsisoli]